MDDIEKADGVVDLVALQGPNQMQLDLGIIRLKRRPLINGFLNPVFTENTVTGI